MDTQPDTGNRGPIILGSCVSCIVLALLVMAVRMWVKISIVKHIGADDWVCASSALVMLVQMILIIVQVDLGAGRHVDALDPEDNVKGLHINFATQPLCLIGLALVKISIGLLLLRLTTSKKFIRFIWGSIILVILSFIANFLVVMFQCSPLAYIWDASVNGKCVDASELKFAAFFNSSVSVLTDVIFAVLPAVLLWRVQLNRRTKIATIPVLSLGFLACCAGITKMFYLDDYGRYGDFLWDSTYITIWTTVEICVAIIAASAYALKPLFQAILKDKSVVSSGYPKRYSVRNGKNNLSSSSAQRIRMKPDYNDVELGSHPSKTPHHGSTVDSQFSGYHHDEALITKTTDLAVFVTDRRPSDDNRLEVDDDFEYEDRHVRDSLA